MIVWYCETFSHSPSTLMPVPLLLICSTAPEIVSSCLLVVMDDLDGCTVVDLDQEVAAAVADVFAAFQATGSAYAVVANFKQRRFPRRAYGGVWAGELRWGRLTHSRVLGVLSNPAYAGVYVFGRYRTQRLVAADGSVRETIRISRQTSTASCNSWGSVRYWPPAAGWGSTDLGQGVWRWLLRRLWREKGKRILSPRTAL